uniref:Uncharacterized protein n=1 Tax=Craspedostauros australis TaxID=1486917 RepID=A0A7R9ZSR0_9STRA|mmetsp:Transcript_8940/g.24179  ORF Transcript_8940/g.24179 Transcript_8940/m.24179 type:complete len:113 (+) Transcript_8940:409-747(+)
MINQRGSQTTLRTKQCYDHNYRLDSLESVLYSIATEAIETTDNQSTTNNHIQPNQSTIILTYQPTNKPTQTINHSTTHSRTRRLNNTLHSTGSKSSTISLPRFCYMKQTSER